MTKLMGIVFAAFLALSGAACRPENRIIEKVLFKPSDNLETVRVALVFNSKRVQSTLAAGFPIKDYGYLFLNPYTGSEPFEVGFDLNTSIVNDQDYLKLDPTTVLPNGVPIGLPYAVVEVKAGTPVGKDFDAYAYVDVLHGEWLGAATIFNFINERDFPAGLSVSQVFLRDPEGRPGVVASVFGPKLNDDGTQARAGGIAVIANFKQLLAHGLAPGQTLELRPEPESLK